MNHKQLLKLKEEFEACETEILKWKWVANNQDSEIVIVLDNDDTFGIIRNKEDDEWVDFQFRNYIGNGPGIECLLDSFGIKSEMA